MSLYMETTEIPAEKTAGEIKALLVAAGATAIYEKYTNKAIDGLSFQLPVSGTLVPFCLPVRVDPIHKILLKNYSRAWLNSPSFGHDRQLKVAAQAKRVAWRQLLRWVQAQLAMIDTGMVQSAEVFMPYVEVAPGHTMFEKMLDNGRLIAAACGTPNPSV